MPALGCVYRPRNPRNSPYFQCVEDYFEPFEQVYLERFERQYGFFRPYVSRVIQRYLDCGDLLNGFARVRCGDCGHEYLRQGFGINGGVGKTTTAVNLVAGLVGKNAESC